MGTAGPAFPDGAYVVRHGVRHFLFLLATLVTWTAFLVALLAGKPRIATDAVLLIGEGVLLIACVHEGIKAARRGIDFAVHAGGVYFGAGDQAEDVPWAVICAVELFRERQSSAKSTSVYWCVGVRARGTRQAARPGNGPAARPLTGQAVQYYLDAGRPDLIAGYDGTIRYAYRRMTGWRVSPAELAGAVRRFAPAVPVINGPNFPPPLTHQDARAAHWARRARKGGRQR